MQAERSESNRREHLESLLRVRQLDRTLTGAADTSQPAMPLVNAGRCRQVFPTWMRASAAAFRAVSSPK